jgi:hypothetical protein
MELEGIAGGAQLCPTAAPAILNDGAAGARGRRSGHLPRIEFRQYREAEGARSRSTAERDLEEIALEIDFVNGPALMVRSNHQRAGKAHYTQAWVFPKSQ